MPPRSADSRSSTGAVSTHGANATGAAERACDERSASATQLVAQHDVIVVAARVAGDAAARAARQAIGGHVGGIGVRVRQRHGDDGARRREQRARIAALVGLLVEVAHVGGIAARQPVAIDGVTGERRDRREADACEAERLRLGAEERGRGGGIERRRRRLHA